MGTWRVLVAVAVCSPGCYAAAGPSIGLDTTTGRTTLGAELTGATVTYGFSKAITDTPRTTRKSWQHRHYLLWEPSIGTATSSFAQVAATMGLLVQVEGPKLGFHLNAAKCELVTFSPQCPIPFPASFAPGRRYLRDFDLLGSPIGCKEHCTE